MHKTKFIEANHGFVKKPPAYVTTIHTCMRVSRTIKRKQNLNKMENLNIQATAETPAIYFGVDGRLMITGRSLPVNVMIFYDPLIRWIKNLKCQSIRMDISLEYANSASAKKILDMMKHFDQNENIKSLVINWHYESDDEDILEMGLIMEELVKNKAIFRFHAYADAA